MSDEFQWWRDALAGNAGPINANQPQPGYYKMRLVKDGPFVPVAIWRKGDVFVCRVMDKMRDPADVWTYCAENPVAKETAKAAFETGEWPGDAPGIGDNSGALSLVEQLSEYAQQSLDWLKGRKIEDKVTADQAANRRAEVLRLKGLVEKEWDAKALPYDTALSELKSTYDGPVKAAKLANESLRAAATAFANAEDARLKAEQAAKFEAERKAAELARKAVEAERAKLCEDDPIAAITSPEPDLPLMPSPPEPVKVSLGGQAGRAAGLRSYWEAEITDHAAALAHYANHPDVIALVAKLAKAEVKTSKGTAKIPGVRGYEDRRVA